MPIIKNINEDIELIRECFRERHNALERSKVMLSEAEQLREKAAVMRAKAVKIEKEAKALAKSVSGFTIPGLAAKFNLHQRTIEHHIYPLHLWLK